MDLAGYSNGEFEMRSYFVSCLPKSKTRTPVAVDDCTMWFMTIHSEKEDIGHKYKYRNK